MLRAEKLALTACQRSCAIPRRRSSLHERRVHWLGLTGDTYEPVERSGPIGLGPDALTQRIDWPA
jgi:hypothetical protein